MQYIPVITLALVVVLLVLVIVLLTRRPAEPPRTGGGDMGGTITALGSLVSQNLKEGREAQRQQLSVMDKSLTDKMGGVTDQLGQFESACTALPPKRRRTWRTSVRRWTKACAPCRRITTKAGRYAPHCG